MNGKGSDENEDMKVITEEDSINEDNIQDLIPLSYRCLNLCHGAKYTINCIV